MAWEMGVQSPSPERLNQRVQPDVAGRGSLQEVARARSSLARELADKALSAFIIIQAPSHLCYPLIWMQRACMCPSDNPTRVSELMKRP